MGKLTTEQLERFMSKVDKTETCWLWTGWTKHNGYGMFDVGIVDGKKLKRIAARVSYEEFVGPLVDGLTIDHIKEVCSSRLCVRPDHLRQITRGENVLVGDTLAAANAAKTHCVRGGHPLSGANLYVCPRGKRNCRICMRENQSKYQRGRATRRVV